MKAFHRMRLLPALLLILSVSFSMSFAAEKKHYPTSPPENPAKKWRIGYYEGGFYRDYPKTLTAALNGLAFLGWIEPLTVPSPEEDMSRFWAWLAANVKSRYLEFAADAFYSNNWDQSIREQTRQIVLKRLRESKDIDLMIAMGTWAGQDLANNEHAVPTMVCSVSDPIAAKIIPSAEDSGFDHVHARVDPKRYFRQIYAFHDVIGFKKLGIIYTDNVTGRSYAAIEDARRIAQRRNFEIAECHTYEGGATPETNARTVECAQKLAPKIDALYLTAQASVNRETLPLIISAMNAAKVPVFSQSGSEEVQQGALLSISSSSNMKIYGNFTAATMAQIINGAKPRDLNQVCEAPPKIAFNRATAKAIGLREDLFQLLSNTAHEVYDTIGEAK
ncbi:MAG: ABC transporter substrate binding protein [Desulfobacterales bacterium]